jgi:ubiquinone/menaquinone biosynthesis C-methylase UbiE
MATVDQMSLAEAYERFLVDPLFRPFAGELLSRLGLPEDASLLDVACGTGIVGRLARSRLGSQARIVGVDAAAPMLAIARRADSSIDWREGNAASLPVAANERFSFVSCHQGLQFFRDKPAALREMRRVLIGGGRVALATWFSIDDMPFSRDLHQVAERQLGPLTDVRHSLGEASVLAGLLVEAGFTEIRIDRVSRDVRGIDQATYVDLNAKAMMAMSPGAKSLSESQRAGLIERLAADSLDALAEYIRDGVFQFTLGTNIATATA